MNPILGLSERAYSKNFLSYLIDQTSDLLNLIFLETVIPENLKVLLKYDSKKAVGFDQCCMTVNSRRDHFQDKVMFGRKNISGFGEGGTGSQGNEN